jgi:membrane-associated phospholipid phosphatase
LLATALAFALFLPAALHAQPAPAQPAPKQPAPAPKQPAPPQDPDVVTSAGGQAPPTPTPTLVQPVPAPPPADPPPPPPPRRVDTQKRAPSLAKRLSWRWPEFRYYQIGLLAGQVLTAIASVAIPGEERMSARNGFDDAARDALRVKIPEGGRYARDASDVGLVLLINQRFVDNLIVTWWFHDKGSTAWQMTLIDAQTISFSASINSIVAGAAGRERPYSRGYCNDSPEDESTDCRGNNRFRSFFSGHATAAFTMAALTCVHHAELPLYGGGPAEAVPCVTSLAVASGVSLLRVAADQHYLTDVLTGAAFGVASGVAIPYAFHYAFEQTGDKAGTNAPAFSIIPTGTGLSITGAF